MAKGRNSREFKAILEEHRNRLNRLIDRRGVAPVKQLYEDANAALERKLAKLAGPRNETMSAHQARVMAAQIKHGQIDITKRMIGELKGASTDASQESLSSLSKSIGRMEKRFTGAATPLPIEEAARFKGIIDKRKTSLLRAHETSMSKYGASVVGAMEDSLFSSVITGDSVGDAIDDVMDVAGGEWWQAERVVRTEMAWAYNSAQADGIADAAKSLPGLMMRWSEQVSDTFVPLDDRVGDDSIAMHGQITTPGGLFTMPPAGPSGEEVSVSLIGKQWSFPPNRPHDRAVVVPWSPEWGVMGWLYSSGERKFVVR